MLAHRLGGALLLVLYCLVLMQIFDDAKPDPEVVASLHELLEDEPYFLK